MCVHPCTCEAQKHIIHIPFLKAEFGYHGDPSSIASMKCAAEDGTSIWLEYDRGEEQMPWLKGCQSQIHKSSWGHRCISDDTTDSEQARQKDICFYTVGRYKNTHIHTDTCEERELYRSLSVHRYTATASQLISQSDWTARAFSIFRDFLSLLRETAVRSKPVSVILNFWVDTTAVKYTFFFLR